MRIGLFSDYYPPSSDGTAIAVDTLRHGLEAEGHQVWIVCPRLAGRPADKRVLEIPSVNWPAYDNLRAIWPFRRRYVEQLSHLKLDLIHIHSPFATGLLGFWAARRLGLPAVMTNHLDMDFAEHYFWARFALPFLPPTIALLSRDFAGLASVYTHGRRQMWWRAISYMSNRCQLVTVPSQKMLDLFQPYVQAPLRVVPNGTQIAQLPPISKVGVRRRLAIPSGQFVAVTTSRLVKEKNICQVLEGLRLAVKKQPRIYLLVVGDGPEMPALKRQAADHGLRRQVRFAGRVKHQRVYSYLAAADVYINSCYYEAASLSVLEAAAMAKPLLIFDDRLVEPLAGGHNGYFVDGPRQLAAKLVQLAGRPELAAEMGRRSRQRISRKFSVKTHAQAMAAAYRGLISHYSG